jgi:DNA-binding Lrp family transcriptional regulator
MAQKAFVLLNIEPAKTKSILKTFLEEEFSEIKRVDYVSGSFDIVLIIETEDVAKATEFVTEKVRTVDGVLQTQTLFVAG